MSDSKKSQEKQKKNLRDTPIVISVAGFEASFWSRVQINGENECWPWIGKDKTPQGYGRCYVKPHKAIASRVAYLLKRGDPIGKCVCHSCDSPSCCNPNHLFLGTDMDNYTDSVKKNRRNLAYGDRNGTRKHPETRPRGENHGLNKHPERRACGERQGSAKLTSSSVTEIRNRFREGEKISAIAEKYSVNWSCIKSIVSRNSWKHIP